MSYSDSIDDNARLLKSTIAGFSDFAGRSRRTEVVYYWIACALLGVIFNTTLAIFGSPKLSRIFSNALRVVLMVPIFALFVRRLHDQGKSGWWALLLPLSLLLSIPSIMTVVDGEFAGTTVQQTMSMSIASGLCSLMVFVLCLWKGTDGVNRYGPDPRFERD